MLRGCGNLQVTATIDLRNYRVKLMEDVEVRKLF
jgi:hypothetical protein